MIQVTKTEVYSDSGKFVHRLGTESYFKRSTLLPGDTAGNFEEVDEIPEETGTSYNEEVNSMIRQRSSDKGIQSRTSSRLTTSTPSIVKWK